MEITIRKAERKDCSRILELIRELAVYEKAPNEVTVTLEHFEESGFGENPVWWGFVASLNPSKGGTSEAITPNSISHINATSQNSPLGGDEVAIVGFVLYYIRYSTWKGQRMYLEDFLVTEQARGKGIGKLLFDKLIEEAKEKKLNGIVWQVLQWNEPAINFYKKYNASFDGEWYNCAINI
ncbi:MAG: GNAT family N-acetyltransferase [Chitinophagaceae bacterium]|jgi:ribosomal protein S18 acetylase RimI-like enzyme|nr:GNAT family N-acetyltransferase [Chitinophagaceae bacterium]